MLRYTILSRLQSHIVGWGMVSHYLLSKMSLVHRLRAVVIMMSGDCRDEIVNKNDY